MEYLLLYLLGWILWSIGYYIVKVYYDKDIWTSKKLIAYRGFISGIWSWFGIFVMITIIITYSICSLNNWIENKLR